MKKATESLDEIYGHAEAILELLAACEHVLDLSGSYARLRPETLAKIKQELVEIAFLARVGKESLKEEA